EEVVAGPDPAALHVGAVVRTDPGQVRGGSRAPQVTGQGGERRQVRGAVGGPVPDAGEVQERQVVVPVVAVHGVVARPAGALVVALPGLARGADQAGQVPGPDRVPRVDLQRVGQRDPERAPAGDGQVVA